MVFLHIVIAEKETENISKYYIGHAVLLGVGVYMEAIYIF